MKSKNTETSFISFFITSKEDSKKNEVASGIDKILSCETFYCKNLVGSFFSCIYNGKLRIHLVFNEDTDSFDEHIFQLITQSMKESNVTKGKIWFSNKNDRLISVIGDIFRMEPDTEKFYYHSTEYIVRRENFNRKYDYTILKSRPYEEKHINAYLELLNDAMSFFIPPEDFIGKKEKYIQDFRKFNKEHTFEAFWKDSKLIGLFWLNGNEIDTMGVASDFQRNGYGSLILTRAVEMVFQQNPDTAYAVLYAVGWNAKAQNFYRKYGMEVNGQYKVPYVDVDNQLFSN